MTSAAVVVSYNRRDLLKECLVALEGQSHPLDEIIVVDNGSTDGSSGYVRESHPGVILFETGKNLGGAGGFSWGVQLAIERGHDIAWLMDDDARPELDAFASIAALLSDHGEEVSFVASIVTNGRDVLNRLNPPEISSEIARQRRAWELGGVAIDTATFVGVAVNLQFAKRTALPIADYFIWGDDLEYTRRLAAMGLGLVLPSSQVNHPDKIREATPMGSRLYYMVRNLIWRNRGRNIGRLAWLKVWVELAAAVRAQVRVSSRGGHVLRTAFRGAIDGFRTHPRAVMPGELTRPGNESSRP
jgi:GT2 family glycosyltransferase